MSGAVSKPVTIDGHPYTLVFKFGTLRLAEKELGESVASVFGGDGEKIGFDAVSAVFWASLQSKHMMAREAADDLIDKAGLQQVLAWVGEGVSAYFGADEPSATPASAEGKVPKPKKAKTRKS